MSNKFIQQDLLNGLKEIFKDAVAKKIDKDNFLDIHVPSINPAKGTHLFFNTSKGVIKIGFYVRDEKFIKSVVENAPTSIEAASNGLRVLGNPEFINVKDALIAAQKFLSAFSNSNVNTEKVTKTDTISKKPLIKSKPSSEPKKERSKDIIDDFNDAIKAFKELNMDAVAKYVQAGNPVLQFSNDNGVIDNFLISMASGGTLNKEKLDLYIKKGLDLDATTSDDDAYTACHFAAWDGNDDVLKMLIDAGANPDIIGGDTMTALNLAAANGHFECVKVLVSYGVDIDNRVTNDNAYHSKQGGTALRDAVINAMWDVADFLIKSGSSLDILNEKCASGQDFFTAVKQIISGLESKEYNLKKLDEIEKKCTKTIKKTKPSKATYLAPYVNDDKYASIALAVLLEIGFDLAGECTVAPASLYDKDLLEERFNGIRGIPTTVIICAGYFEDDILTTEDLKVNFPKIVNEVRQWYIKLAVTDIDILIPSIKASIKTIAKDWDDYMAIHGKLLCGYIKEIANAKGLESDNGKMMVQLVLDGLEISEEDWNSNEEEAEEEDEDSKKNIKKTAKKAVPKVKNIVKEEEIEEEDEDIEEEEDNSNADILAYDKNADKYYRKELNRFLQIAERTGILTNDIVSEPTIQERDELWDITRIFLDRIYSIDNETYPNEYEVNLLCFYSIVALHWCDIYVTDKRFSFENGRFRRDTIALVLCLSTRVSYTFENYDLMHNGFVMPHMYFSALLWTIRTIIAKKEDVYFDKYTVADAEKALQLFMSIDKKNQQQGSSGFIEMKQVPDGHPLLNIWLDLIKLFINERPPFSFILKYISNDTNHSTLGILKGLFGGNKSNAGEFVTLIPKDLESNNSFLHKRIESISFEDSWPFMNDLMFTAHHMILLQNKTMPKDALNVILTKSSEWVSDLDLKDVQKKYKEVVKEYEKNHSDIRVKFVLGKMYKYMTLQNKEDIEQRDTQLKLVLGDLIEIAKSDTSNTDNHFGFIAAINDYWGGVLTSDNNSNTKGAEDVEEEYPEQGLPVIDCTANEAKVINPFLRVSTNYNEIDNIEARLPKWIKSLLASAVLTPDQIDILSEQIKKNKAIPVLKYAPKECFNYVKSVWWFIPLVIWKEDVLSSIVVDKNGLYSIASSDTTELSLISPFDRVTEYTLDKLEPSIERLTLFFDNGAFQTFDCFVDDSQSTYLSIIAAILDVRMETINKSKKSAGWKEGAGGEGFIEFENVTQLYDLKYWKKTEISRPDPRFFG